MKHKEDSLLFLTVNSLSNPATVGTSQSVVILYYKDFLDWPEYRGGNISGVLISVALSLGPQPNFHMISPAIFWVQHILKTHTESSHWFTPSHEIVQGVAMVSDPSRGSEKTVNLVG